MAVLTTVALAIPLWAQFGPQMPQMRGMWHPVVGQGAAYQMQGHGGNHEMEIAVVGKEDFQGQTGYWLEMTSGEMAAHAGASKMLWVMEPPNPGVKRMIMLMNGQAYEFPMNNPMMAGRAPKADAMDITKGAGVQKVGTETITTPAGSFECEHYRSGDPPSDVWVSAKVSPWGLVKSQSKDSTMVLTKLITDAKTKITGPVKPFDAMQMIQQQQRP